MVKAKQAVEKKPLESGIEAQVKALTILSGKIDKINQSLKEHNKQYEELERGLLETMQRDGLTQVATKAATAFVTKRTFVSMEDFDQFTAFVFKNKAVDLLYRRVNQRAYLDRLENGVAVPGVSKTEIPTVSLRRK